MERRGLRAAWDGGAACTSRPDLSIRCCECYSLRTAGSGSIPAMPRAWTRSRRPRRARANRRLHAEDLAPDKSCDGQTRWHAKICCARLFSDCDRAATATDPTSSVRTTPDSVKGIDLFLIIGFPSTRSRDFWNVAAFFGLLGLTAGPHGISSADIQAHDRQPAGPPAIVIGWSSHSWKRISPSSAPSPGTSVRSFGMPPK